MESIKKFIKFLAESWHEVRHQVTYPTREEVRGLATVVIVTSAIFAVYLSVIDVIMAQLVKSFFDMFT